jgi:hypothetical protein
MEKMATYFTFHEKEKKLIEFIRQLQFGEVTIKVQDGLPVLVERATEKVKLRHIMITMCNRKEWLI